MSSSPQRIQKTSKAASQSSSSDIIAPPPCIFARVPPAFTMFSTPRSALRDPILRRNVSVQLEAILISLAILAVIVVTLRVWARIKTVARLGWDDYTMIVATILLCPMLAAESISKHGTKLITRPRAKANLSLVVKYGLGVPLVYVDQDEVVQVMKAVYASEMIYLVCIATIRVSILIMYLRYFPPRIFRAAAWFLSVLTIASTIIFTFICAFQCKPIARAWDRRILGHCLNIQKTFIGNAMPNIGVDIIILFLPIYHVWNLKIRLIQRVTLTMIFLLGGSVIFASTYRLVTLLRLDPENTTYNLKAPILLTHVELCAAIISGCLPCLRPLFTSLLRTIGFTSSHPSSNKAPSHVATIGARSIRRKTGDNFEELEGEEEDQWSLPRKPEIVADHVPLRSI